MQPAASQVVAPSVRASEPQQQAPQQASKVIQIPAARVGRKYLRRITAEGGKLPHTFSLASGELEAVGLSLNADGLLTGVPTQPGLFQFSVAVQDAAGGSAAVQSYRLRVLPPR